MGSHGPETIAKQLLRDKTRILQGEHPSDLAIHLPKTSTLEAADIGAFLAPPARDLHPSIARLLYQNTREQILGVINGVRPIKGAPPEDGYRLVADLQPSVSTAKGDAVDDLNEDETEPTDEEFESALKVLRFVGREESDSVLGIDDIIDLLTARLKSISQRKADELGEVAEYPVSDVSENIGWTSHAEAYREQRPGLEQRHCYICKYGLRHPHPIYKSMCRPCGDFNIAGLRISIPESLKLAGRTALVTGARVNLGYHTALRMLRCGARVIASTRYPNDAAIRYSKEADLGVWKDRLLTAGADFRTARDAFALVEATKQALKNWNVSTLDILINNAAQTLTDSVKKEQRAIYLEQQQEDGAADTGLVFRLEGSSQYCPRIRGGVATLALYGVPKQKSTGFEQEPEKTLTLPGGIKDDGRTELEPYFKSSWVQNLAEIPYEDIISAHAVNTFVPLILCRELLPLMGAPLSHNVQALSQTPQGYIINVSSREGIFEIAPGHRAKGGKHVHTNMSKAALNMITQTEASEAWQSRLVAMNSVDPGYMSAAPEIDGLFENGRPIGWEDGAGRVLWPVAIGEVEGKAVWGRFLKHYGAVEVDSTLNRG